MSQSSLAAFSVLHFSVVIVSMYNNRRGYYSQRYYNETRQQVENTRTSIHPFSGSYLKAHRWGRRFLLQSPVFWLSALTWPVDCPASSLSAPLWLWWGLSSQCTLRKSAAHCGFADVMLIPAQKSWTVSFRSSCQPKSSSEWNTLRCT